jgi:hypothetical protein
VGTPISAKISSWHSLRWTTRGSRSRRRRVVAKAERMPGRSARSAKPRFVVTSPNAVRADARTLYEQMY